MRLLSKVVFGAAALAMGATLAASSVFAHATIKTVAWDNPVQPTKVIATAQGDDISNEPGTFYLRVYHVATGSRVDRDDAAVSLSNPKVMTVSVPSTLVPGEYRVDWGTVSAEDGEEASGSLSLVLAAAAPTQAPTQAPAPPAGAPAAPTAGDAGLAAAQQQGSWAALTFVAALVLGAVPVSLLAVRRRARH